MQLREKQLNLKRNPINPAKNDLVTHSNNKYSNILNQLEKFDVTHDSIKNLSKKIFDLDNKDEVHNINTIQDNYSKIQNEDYITEVSDEIIEKKAKLQIEKLNQSFSLLIKEKISKESQLKKETQDELI